MAGINCWEHRHCGREPGGAHADEHGICPAASETRLDGVHGGVNAGRACWAVAGSLGRTENGCSCESPVDCFHCDFYRAVITDETPHLVYTPAIMSLLDGAETSYAWLKGSQEPAS